MTRLIRTDEYMDLVLEEREEQSEKVKKPHLKKTKIKVYQKIAQKYGKEIELIKDIPKNRPSTRTTIRMYDLIYKNAEQLRDAKRTSFKTISEVIRSAVYLGIMIIFHMHYDIDDNYSTRNMNPDLLRLNRMLETTENGFFSAFLTDDIVEKIMTHFTWIDRGIVKKEQGLEAINQLIEDVPDDIKPYCKDYVKKVLKGDKPIHVFEKARKGRPQIDE